MLAVSIRKRNVRVWCPVRLSVRLSCLSVCLSHLHTHRDSPLTRGQHVMRPAYILARH